MKKTTTGKAFQSDSVINICIVTPHYPTRHLVNSGIANHFYELANGLSQLGHQVHVLFVTDKNLTEDDILVEVSENQKVKIYLHPISIKLPNWIETGFKGRWAQILILKKLGTILHTKKVLSQLVKKHNIDVIETTSYDFLCLAYLFKRNRPLIVTRVSTTLKQINRDHYEFVSRAIKIASALEGLMIRLSDRLTTHTLAHRDEVCNDFKINQDRFKIIPHGIQLPEKITFEKSYQPLKKINVLYVGRFEYRKGIDVLLEAIPLVLEKMNKIYFTLVGQDKDYNYQQNFQNKWGKKFNDCVNFIGTVNSENLHHMYQECDLFVAASRYESFGLIYVEAMSYGKPVIGCKTGGIPEVIEEKVTGLLAQPGDSKDLAEKILKLAGDADLRHQMGQQGRLRVERLFSREQMAKQTIKNYSVILP
ncbi:glycosyl transferases group 1 family protein [Lyngbya aestuarii BL J]|uniref:Glycosyl transferases group 1 family protein n=1 Tax=Lyngbya aestuarii BL J TaxID=1348334 RepID=U7QP64_9CYAN|nr:glycosyltransferase family 4 protein [Lyngbya aestuarii]ERT08196.1 glycosyl transferases group 1 family protein [Lyngbya aestuarii BL J]